MTRVRTHPGEVLREEYLAPLGMSAHQLADAIDVPANRISEIVRENRSVTADTALRLAEHFKTTPEFWLNLQMAHDLSKAAAEAPAGRYFTAGSGSPVTGKWTTRETAKAAAKILSDKREVAGSTLSQRGGSVKNKPVGKGDRHPTKRK